MSQDTLSPPDARRARAAAGAAEIDWPRIARAWLVWAALVAIACVMPMIFTSGFATSILAQMGIAIVFALSYNMLLGQGGMLSFGHAVFFGLGGFLSIHAINKVLDDGWWIPLELIPLVGGFMGLVMALIFGALGTKRSGTAFAMITLGLGELVAASALMFSSFFGGESGVSGDRWTEVTLLPFTYGPPIQVYYLIVAWATVAAALMYLHTKTPLGRLANAVRDNPERVAFIGYNTQMVRLIQYGLAGGFAGIAGGLFAIQYEILTFDSVGAIQSASVLLMTYIGGIGHFAGPVLGAILFTLMQTVLGHATGAWPIYFGLVFIGIVMFAPGGLAGIIMAHEAPRRAGLLGRLALPYARAAIPAFAAFLGTVLFVELNFEASSSLDRDGFVPVFWVQVPVASPVPWILSVVLFALGVWDLNRRALPGVGEAWGEIREILKRGEAGR